MGKAKDPVCGTWIEPSTAAGRTTYESRDVYFCSDQCRRDFETNPAHYYNRLERRDPRFISSNGVLSVTAGRDHGSSL
jgi:YHS domain-containing protein